ncbi:MAG: hypothetical protein R6W75_02010 [Smithellaceae bacterium]
MKSKEDSSFLQGVESRLDSLFADDTDIKKDKKDASPRSEAIEADKPAHIEDIDEPAITMEPVKVEPLAPSDESGDIAADDFEEMTPDIKEKLSLDIKDRPAASQESEKSSFISEIEKRFSAIFGEDNIDASTDTSMSRESTSFQEVVAKADTKVEVKEQEPVREPEGKPEVSFDEFPSPTLVMASPLKNVKSVVLSIEWEISDEILEQFEEELNKLYLLYTGDKVILGFVRILRFLGRYIRVRGANSNQESINLLLSVYDQLENVMVSSDMTEVKKHLILLDNVKKYRGWVETTDLEAQDEAKSQVPEAVALEPVEPLPTENKPVVSEPEIPDESKSISLETSLSKVESPDVDRISGLSLELPSSDIAKFEDRPEPAVPLKDWTEQAAGDIAIDETPGLASTVSSGELETSMPPEDDFAQRTIAAIKEMAPHEAFGFALDELRKTFSGEIAALKSEIEDLKNARKADNRY